MNGQVLGVDDDVINRIAEVASCDGRSVIRKLAGLPVRGPASKRIDAVLERLGVTVQPYEVVVPQDWAA